MNRFQVKKYFKERVNTHPYHVFMIRAFEHEIYYSSKINELTMYEYLHFEGKDHTRRVSLRKQMPAEDVVRLCSMIYRKCYDSKTNRCKTDAKTADKFCKIINKKVLK